MKISRILCVFALLLIFLTTAAMAQKNVAKQPCKTTRTVFNSTGQQFAEISLDSNGNVILKSCPNQNILINNAVVGSNNLAGDVTGALGANTVSKIQNRAFNFPIFANINDTFTGNTINPTAWTINDPTGTHVTQNGTALQILSAGSGNIGIASVNNLNLFGSQVSIDILSNTTAAYEENSLWMGNATNNASLSFVQPNAGSDVNAYFVCRGTGFSQQVIYNGRAEKARLRHLTTGSLIMEIYRAVNGWVNVCTVPTTNWDLAAGKFQVYKSNFGGLTTVSNFTIDNFQTALNTDLGNNSLLMWDSNAGAYVPVQLTTLKAALAALP